MLAEVRAGDITLQGKDSSVFQGFPGMGLLLLFEGVCFLWIGMRSFAYS